MFYRIQLEGLLPLIKRDGKKTIKFIVGKHASLVSFNLDMGKEKWEGGMDVVVKNFC